MIPVPCPRASRQRILPWILLAASVGLPAILSAASSDEHCAEECTIAILSGRATVDGRPILWKNRDTGVLNNEVVYFEDGLYRYVALVNAGELNRAWIGLNERGFAVLNALSYNLPDSLNGGITNGELMKLALQICATVEDFESLLTATNEAGRENPANLAVLDGVGGATMFEVGNRSWRRFDATDPVDAPEGFIARTNFSLSADTTSTDTSRYHRCRNLLAQAVHSGGAEIRGIVQQVSRDLRSTKIDPYPLPFEGSPPGYPDAKWYVDADDTINRRQTAAAGAVLGVLPGEDPLLSTFFGIVGQPVVTIALPVWVAAGPTPPELDGKETSPLCDLAVKRMLSCYDHPSNGTLLNTRRLVNENRSAYLALVERTERWLFPEVGRHLLGWRTDGIDPAEMAFRERQIAADAFTGYQGGPLPPPETVRLDLQSYPNPMRGATSIRYELVGDPPPGWSIDVVDLSGRRIRRLAACDREGRSGCLSWDGRDARGAEVAAGVYFLRPSWQPGKADASLVVLR